MDRLKCNICQAWRDQCPYGPHPWRQPLPTGRDPFVILREIYDASCTYEADYDCPPLLHELHAELTSRGMVDEYVS